MSAPAIVAQVESYFARLPFKAEDASSIAALRALVDRFASDPHALPDALTRFRWLAAVAAHDAVAAKLLEPQLDAFTILSEVMGPDAAVLLDQRLACGGLWAVWAAGGPGVLAADRDTAGRWRLTGRKSWCSGAHGVAAALVTASAGAGAGRLFALALDAPGIDVTAEGWKAIGMAGTASVDVRFDDVAAEPVGEAGAYLARPGFWHGAAGIAACWHGIATGIAAPLRQRAARGAADLPLLAHLGAVDVALAGSAAVLRDAAADIDLQGARFGQREALRVRATVEAACEAVLRHTGRALGAAPLCRDATHARRVVDLEVFLRQGHAEWDLAVAGKACAEQGATGDPSWWP